MHARFRWLAETAVILLLCGCNSTPVQEENPAPFAVQAVSENSEALAEIASRTADDIQLGSFTFQQVKKQPDDKKLGETVRKKAMEIRGEKIQEKPTPGILDLLIDNCEHLCLGIVSLYCVITGIVKGTKNAKHRTQNHRTDPAGNEKRQDQSVGRRKSPANNRKATAEKTEEK